MTLTKHIFLHKNPYTHPVPLMTSEEISLNTPDILQPISLQLRQQFQKWWSSTLKYVKKDSWNILSLILNSENLVKV